MKAEQVRTFIIVTIVTVLVWLFAESRTLRVETITVPVQISLGGRTLVFRITDESDWNSIAEIELAGPVGKIGDIRAAALDGITLELGDELPNEPGVRTVDLRDAIRRDALFKDSGVTIRRVVPETVGLQVDRLETLRLPVEVDLAGVETSGPVRVVPAEVEVQLPASHAEGHDYHAVAKVDTSRLSTLTPGRRAELSQIPIELQGLPEDIWGLRLNTPRVTVSLTLRARTESMQLPELPVYVEMSPSDLALWSVEIPPKDRVLSGVTLTGPGALIDRVRRGEIRPRAVVPVSSEDLQSGVKVVKVQIEGLPPGVVVNIERPEVRVIATPRAAGSPG